MFKKVGNLLYRSLLSVRKAIAVVTSVTIIAGIGSVPVVAGDYAKDMYIEYNSNVYRYNDRLVTINIEGNNITTGEMPGIILNGSTMVPVREVFENQAIGANVSWNGTTKEINIKYGNNTVVLKIDSRTAYVNNKAVEMQTPAMLIRDMSKSNYKTMIPIRFVSENLGFNVKWDKESYTASVTKPVVDSTTGSGNTDSQQVEDSTVVAKDQLDKLVATKANRALPTALYNNPIIFKADPDLLSSAISGTAMIDTSKSRTFAAAVATSNVTTYPKATVSDISYNDTTKAFEIKAKTEITSYSAHVWDGKVIVQINNSNSGLLSNSLNFSNNAAVTAIRIGENVDAQNIPYTKAVFDVKSATFKFTMQLSSDRKMIKITPSQSTGLSVEILEATTTPDVVDTITVPTVAVDGSISEMKLAQNEIGDYIDITGVDGTNIKAFRLSNPSRIVFDFPETTTLLGFQSATAQGQYVTSIRTSQFEPTKARLVIETDGQADFSIIKLTGSSARIQLIEPQYENISYDNTQETPTINIDNDGQSGTITLNNITYTDNYNERKFKIVLPGDYTSYFGTNKMQVNDSVIQDISFVLNSEKNTVITITSTSIREFRIEETSNGLAIKAYKPKELYKNVIVLDAGHGGNDPGANLGTLKESDINLGVMLELKKLMPSITNTKVYYTRTTDVRPTLEQRATLANEVEADFFISLHCNSFGPTYRGTETLYFPGSTASGLTSAKLAKIIQTQFTANTELEDYALKERTNLYVLKYTTMPAIILEMGYITNDYDRSFLSDKNYYDDLAKGVYLGIVEVIKQYPTNR